MKKKIYAAAVIAMLLLPYAARAGKIHKAAKKGDIQKIKTLALKGPEVINEPDEEGKTALHYAVIGGHYAIAEIILDKGADVNARDNLGNTPLHYAAAGGNRGMVHMMLFFGADVNAKNNDGKTPLNIATENKYDRIVEILKENGAVD